MRIISVATLGGTVRGSLTRPPAPATSPTLTSLSANRAVVSATTRWQASAISQPPPMAKPLTAAMTGLGMLAPAGQPGEPVLRHPHGLTGCGVDQVVAGGEGLLARSGQDRDPQVVVGEVGVEDVVELVVRHRVQAVPGLGAVDGDLEQVAVPADQHVLVRLAQHRRLRREQLVHPLPAGGDPVTEAERPDVNRLADGLFRGAEQVQQAGVRRPWRRSGARRGPAGRRRCRCGRRRGGA